MQSSLLLLLQPILGLTVITGLAWALSEDRRAVQPRLIIGALALQFVLAALLLKVPAAKGIFLALNDLVLVIQESTEAGTKLVFGFLGGGPTPFELTHPQFNYALAFRALPLLIVISALSALLFHWGILPLVVRGFAWVLGRTLGTGGPLGLSAAANVFVGMVEAPLLIRPYLAGLSRSALFGVMTCGMAGVAGTVMILYAGILGPVVPDAMGHILVASIISAPAALLVAGVLIPETLEQSDRELIPMEAEFGNSMDAITRGTLEAIPLWLNVIAMLVVMIALVGICNHILAVLPDWGGAPLTAQRVLGWVMAPLVWLIGIPWSEATTAGALMGVKTVLNELVAYLQLAALPPGALSPRSALIMTYALCGFANLGSLGILIGGMGAMVPQRRHEIVQLGMKSVVAGTFATLMTGAVVAVLI
ncbi:nucleoside transporter C-terminal domain-containing protein [uncultured Thiodictyon sp.]|uniref:NupC/NupG family nucleoside CNT transporter n=1 Tax=uncultured Thiodictyon sp. TaxID=1846217 RepID=UPI0025EE3D0C|nr:nucleoside transporter C-terminal domain-containing protein [uncultured Thiodictyon sp.]